MRSETMYGGGAVLLRKVRGIGLTPFVKGATTFIADLSVGMGAAVGALTALMLTPLAMIMLAVSVLALGAAMHALPAFGAPSEMVLLGTTAVATRDLKTILADLKKLQDEYKGKAMPAEVGEKFEALAAEAKVIQDEAERDGRVKGFEQWSRGVPDPILPNANGKEGEGQTRPTAKSLVLGEEAIVGYLSLGAATIASPEFQEFYKRGAPKGMNATVEFATREDRYGRLLVPVTAKMAQSIRERIQSKAIDGKAVPTIGANVIEPDRIAEVVRATEQDRLRLRDVLNVSTTDSNAIEYVTIDSYTRAATEVAESGTKPEATMVLGTATAPVRTIAVHMPVTMQQLQDIPQIRNMIDVELQYDLDKEEEEQFMYGSGAGQELQGILPLAGVPAITRTVTNTQNLDRIRIGITDVMIAGNEPNAVAVHPIDWEAIVLLKGTTNEYIWSVVTNNLGEPRVWGVRVVETVAMKNPANLQRYLLVGDFIRGATVWDRMQTQVIVGMINDQLIKNLRTILAEKRVAFGIKRPKAFAKFETATAV